MPLGWGDIDWEDIFSELNFLPDTVLMMEVGARYRYEQAECLERAKRLMMLNNGRSSLAAE
jgi:sugar phosphate isomerase/epimerase